jgi:hypothetical protein
MFNALWQNFFGITICPLIDQAKKSSQPLTESKSPNRPPIFASNTMGYFGFRFWIERSGAWSAPGKLRKCRNTRHSPGFRNAVRPNAAVLEM